MLGTGGLSRSYRSATELFNKGRSYDLLLLERDHGTVPSVLTESSLTQNGFSFISAVQSTRNCASSSIHS